MPRATGSFCPVPMIEEILRRCGNSALLASSISRGSFFSCLHGASAAGGFYSLTHILPTFLPTAMSIGFELEGAVISGVIFSVGMALLYTNYTLTEFGKRLQGSALRFYPTRTKLREFRIASLVPSGFLSWAVVACSRMRHTAASEPLSAGI